MNPDQRTETQLDTFIEPPAQVGTLILRPFSAGTLTLCRKLGLTLIVGGAEEKAAITEEEKQRQITTFIFIQSAPLDDVLRAAKLARKDRTAFEEDILLPFELSLPVEVMVQAMEQIAGNAEQIASAQFDAVPKDGASSAPRETPPPNS